MSKEYIIVIGERALVSLYGGANDEGLDVLRYRRFCDKISKGTSHVEPRTLPPTSAAAMYHSLRVYYHAMYRKGKGDSMKPEEWDGTLWMENVYQCRLTSLRHQQNC